MISDFKSAVSVILRAREEMQYLSNPYSTNYYKAMCYLLELECRRLNVDAVWVCSRFPNERHLEVDQLSKTVLAEFLGAIK